MLLRPRHSTPPPPGESVLASRALVIALTAFLMTPVVRVAAQDGASEAPLSSVGFLVGSWEGEVAGELGVGRAIREYEVVLDGQFLLSRHASVRLPQEESPAGDHHRELGVFSYDQQRSTIMYRQFVVEGYVNRYTCALHGGGLHGFTCVTEAVENGPELRGRWTVTAENEFVFDEEFELAEPGEDFTLLFTNRWVRRPALN